MSPTERASVDQVEQKRLELEKSPFVAGLFRILKSFQSNVDKIRFIAVGNFGIDNMNVEYQTALVLLMRDRFNAKEITAWDPNFKKRDLCVSSELGIHVVKNDPKPDSNTSWFAPHAPYYLEPESSTRIGKNVYIGNDLNLTTENTMRDAKACEPYRVNAKVVASKVKPKDSYREAFKNTAVHQLSLVEPAPVGRKQRYIAKTRETVRIKTDHLGSLSIAAANTRQGQAV